MRQILYVSSSVPEVVVDLAQIVERSQANNATNGITGLLYADGTRFLQVLEGREDQVAATFARIDRDPRHRGIVVLSDRTVEAREFGGWAMAQRSRDESADAFDTRIRTLVEQAAPAVRGTFLGLVPKGEARAS